MPPLPAAFAFAFGFVLALALALRSLRDDGARVGFGGRGPTPNCIAVAVDAAGVDEADGATLAVEIAFNEMNVREASTK
jgi:hypothetical protein